MPDSGVEIYKAHCGDAGAIFPELKRKEQLSNMKQSNNCQRTVKEITTFGSQPLLLVNRGIEIIIFAQAAHL